jgi:hypothetical protein
MLGPRTRPRASTVPTLANASTKRPWGYSIPDAETWQDQ